MLVGQKVENHSRPAGVAAPAPTEEQRPEYFGDGVMQNARPRHAGKQVVPKTFNLHVLLANQSEEDEHVGAHAKLDELPGVFLFRRYQHTAHPDAGADVSEVEQEEQVACRKPQRYGNDLEHGKQDDGGSVLFHDFLFWAGMTVLDFGIVTSGDNRHGLQSRFGHQTAFHQVAAALQVEFGPVAVFAAGRETLGAPTVRQAPDGAVDPAEAQGFLHRLHVWDAVGARLLAAVDRHPALLGGTVVLGEPQSELGTGGVF